MSLTKSELKKLIQEVAQNEGFLDSVGRMFAEPEEPTDLDRAVEKLKKDHKMQISHDHPLHKILSKADPADLQSLVSRLEQPYGADTKSFTASRMEEGLDMMDQNVLEGMLQIMNNFAIVSWPALALAVGMTGAQAGEALKKKVKSHAAKKAGVNIKTQWNQ